MNDEKLELLNGPVKTQPKIVREGDGERRQRLRETKMKKEVKEREMEKDVKN